MIKMGMGIPFARYAKAAEYVTGAADGNYAVDDHYDVVGSITSDDIGVLESALDSPYMPEIDPNDAKITTGEEFFPKILYSLSFKQDGEKGKYTIHQFSKSEAAMLRNGLFLTAHHAFEPFDSENDDSYVDYKVIYDPKTGFSGNGRVIAFSDIYDIVLGKVDVPSVVSEIQPNIVVPASDKHPLDMLYMVSYDKPEYIKGGLVRELVEKGLFLPEESDFMPRDLSPRINVGKNPAAITGHMNEWENLFLCEGKLGMSGSPVYDLHNRLSGIFTSNRVSELDTGMKLNIAQYTKPSKIRGLFENAISKNSSRHTKIHT